MCQNLTGRIIYGNVNLHHVELKNIVVIISLQQKIQVILRVKKLDMLPMVVMYVKVVLDVNYEVLPVLNKVVRILVVLEVMNIRVIIMKLHLEMD